MRGILRKLRTSGWARQCAQALSLSVLNIFELGNALRHAEFKKALRIGECGRFWALF